MSDIDIKAKVSDAIKQSEIKSVPKFCGFFSASEKAEILPLLKGVKHGFFGGYDEAERTVLLICPEWLEIENAEYPINALTFLFRKQDKLSHRDFLGSLMALGIKRNTVGDILVEEGRAVVFLLSEISEYVVGQIEKIGRVGVEIKAGFECPLPGMSGFIEETRTVASLRLDCVVSALSGKSRNASAELINAGLVALNSVAALKPTATVKNLDAIAIRGIGKFIIVSSDDLSKKGRIILKWKKYI